jgi:hypothetical protein
MPGFEIRKPVSNIKSTITCVLLIDSEPFEILLAYVMELFY